jgi:hypothetical protein
VVVVAAALIMTAIFSGFIGAGDPVIKMIGFGLATAPATWKMTAHHDHSRPARR